MHLLLALLLACGGGPSTRAPLPAPLDDVRLPLTDTVVTPDGGAFDLHVTTPGLQWRPWLDKASAGLQADGWELTNAMPIPGGMAAEYTRKGKTLSILAGGNVGDFHVRVQAD